MFIIQRRAKKWNALIQKRLKIFSRHPLSIRLFYSVLFHAVGHMSVFPYSYTTALSPGLKRSCAMLMLSNRSVMCCSPLAGVTHSKNRMLVVWLALLTSRARFCMHRRRKCKNIRCIRRNIANATRAVQARIHTFHYRRRDRSSSLWETFNKQQASCALCSTVLW